jgi:hypothetical protein
VKNYLKYTLLLFYAVLAFAGQSAANGAGAPYTLAQPAEENKSPDRLSVNELHKFVGLQRAEEQVSTPAPFPGPTAKEHAVGFAASAYALELRIQATTAQYLLHVKSIRRSLTSPDIVFPFHYFW